MNKIRNLPNLLSLSRIVLGVLFFLLINQQQRLTTLISLLTIIVSLVTDYLDGKMARKNRSVSIVGKWIDPISDFIFFFFVFLSFLQLDLMPLPLFLIFIGRESAMYLVIRPLTMIRKLDPGAKLPGKIKTGLQIAGSIATLLLYLLYQEGLLQFSTVRRISLPLLAVVVASSVLSLYWYIRPLLQSGLMQKHKKSLTRLILSIIGGYLLYQVLFCIVLAIVFPIHVHRIALFLAITCLYHGFLLFGLNLIRKEFVLDSTGAELDSLNLPLFLSFLRITSVPTLLFMLMDMEAIPVLTVTLPYLCLIFLTDFFDGILARSLKQTTRLGGILDSSGDYIILLAISVLFLHYRLIPLWFFSLLGIRLLIQAVGMVILYFLQGYTSVRVTFIGKALVFSIMALYAFELFVYWKIPSLGEKSLVTILEYLVGFLVLVSLAERLGNIGKQLYAQIHRHSG